MIEPTTDIEAYRKDQAAQAAAALSAARTHARLMPRVWAGLVTLDVVVAVVVAAGATAREPASLVALGALSIAIPLAASFWWQASSDAERATEADWAARHSPASWEIWAGWAAAAASAVGYLALLAGAHVALPLIALAAGAVSYVAWRVMARTAAQEAERARARSWHLAQAMRAPSITAKRGSDPLGERLEASRERWKQKLADQAESADPDSKDD